MAHFVKNGKNLISGQKLTVTQGRPIRLGLYGPINLFVTPHKELVVVADPASRATATRSPEAITNDIRIWTITGNNPGDVRIQAKPDEKGKEIWHEIVLQIQASTATATDEAFINKVAREGGDTARRYGLPVSIMIAMACKESGFGRGPHMAINSLFGITKRKELSTGKERDWYPKCRRIDVRTTPSIAGKPGRPDLFCAASSYQEAVEIWAQYVKDHPHSKGVTPLFKGGPWTDPQLQTIADHMHQRLNFGVGNPNYGTEVINVINRFGLKEFD